MCIDLMKKVLTTLLSLNQYFFHLFYLIIGIIGELILLFYFSHFTFCQIDFFAFINHQKSFLNSSALWKPRFSCRWRQVALLLGLHTVGFL